MSSIWRSCLLPAVLLAVALFLFASPAKAQTPSPFAAWQNDEGEVMRGLGGPFPTWDIYAGGGLAVIPKYEGSKHYQVVPAPAFDIRYKDIAFLSTGEGIGINLLRGVNYRAGVAIGYDVGRSQHAERAINGIGSISPAPVARAFAEAYFLPFVIQTDLRQALGGVNGLAGDIGVYMPVVGNEKLVIFVGPGVTIANDRYMQRYFGIGTTQAAPNSRFQPYKAQGGFANANFGVSAMYNITEKWILNGDIGYERLVGSAAGSPIVETKNQLGASLVLLYHF